MTAKRLVLVGGGRAHLHVLRELARRPLAGVETVVVASNDPYHAPMVPGFVQGQYAASDLRFDLARLATRAGARFVRGTADRIDVAERVVLVDGERIGFDVCSLDVGCEVADASTPGVAEHAISLRPAHRALELRARLDGLIAEARPLSLVVVGGGGGGVEAALAIHQRLRAAAAIGHVVLIERGMELLADYEADTRRLATDVLRARGVSLALGGRVVSVTASSVALQNGATLPADLVVWAEGPCAPALVVRSGLAHDADGYMLVDRSLRAADGAPVWGAGEAVTLKDFPALPKAGPYAVRDAPALDRSLRAALGHGRPAKYRPQRSSLALLNSGGGWALMQWKGVHRHSRWAWRLKDMIDRRFVRRYQGSDEKARTPG